MVRPIDISDNLSKTVAAEKINQIEKSAPDAAQRQFSLSLSDQAAERQRKTQASSKTDEAIIHREKEKEKRREKKKKKKSDKKNNQQLSIDLKA